MFAIDFRCPGHSRLCALALAILAIWFTSHAGPSSAAPRFDGRVIVEAMQYPWSALGRVNVGGRGHCTGVLVSERHVLTKAHCLYYPTEGRWWSASELHFVAGYQRDVVRIHSAVAGYRVAPKYSRGGDRMLADFAHDWALLTLSRPIGRSAGWMAVQWLDERTQGGLARGEAHVLEAGYRAGQAHVVTVGLSCGIDSMMRARLVRSGDCAGLEPEAGLATLLFMDGEFRVLGTPSMKRDARLRSVRAGAGAGPEGAEPQQALNRILDDLGYRSAPVRVAVRAAAPDAGARPVRLAMAPSGSAGGSSLTAVLAAGLDPAPAPAKAKPRKASLATTLAAAKPRHNEPSAAAAAARKPAPAAAVPKAARGTYVVQLASYTSPQGAEQGRTTLQRRLSKLLAGAKMFIAQAVHAELGTVYRVRTGPYTTLAAARDACGRLRANSHDCIVMQ